MSTLVNTLQIGDGEAVIRHGGRSAPVVAKILAIERREGREVVYLDRVVHRQDESWEGWAVTGAVSSVFSRQA